MKRRIKTEDLRSVKRISFIADVDNKGLKTYRPTGDEDSLISNLYLVSGS